MSQHSSPEQFFAVVIGTGFGGAVTACRLAQAIGGTGDRNKRICILERGRRYASSDFPDLPKEPFALPDPHRWLWDSNQGLFDARHMGAVGILQAAGYGGGSLIYANVHLRPPENVFDGWPGGINRAVLDEYYDLVAAMLDIRPVPDTAVPRKAKVLEDAAATLGATTLRPPIAVSFEPGYNDFGREKKACTNCGGCCFGCREGAKNTLDQNYLAVVEEQFPDIAEIRTLCEVVAISEAEYNGGYEILYRDFTRRERLFRTDGERRACTGPEYHRVTAENVFVCGGAINSTELLMRSRRAHEIRLNEPHQSLPSGLSRLSSRLGQDYFPNADAIAMAFDTESRIEPSVGPTITTAAVFSHENEWFLVEDGAYPKEVRHFFDMAFRSGLLLDSNRYLTESCRVARSKGAGGFAWPAPRVSSRTPAGRPPNPIEAFATAVASHAFDDVIPRPFSGSLFSWWEFLRTAVDNRNEVGRITALIKGGLPRKRVEDLPRLLRPKWLLPLLYGVADVGARILFRFGGVTDNRVCDLAQPAIDESFYLTTPGQLIRHSCRTLVDALAGGAAPVRPDVPEGTRIPKTIGPRGNKDPWEHRSLFLIMGRDDRPFKLRVPHARSPFFDDLGIEIQRPQSPESFQTARTAPELRANQPGRVRTAAEARRKLLRNFGSIARRAGQVREAWHETTYTAEELFLRDLTNAMGGELRTNPLWTLGGVPVSSHSQGGCAMSDHRDGVTDSYGKVRNYDGLYINDGSLFPKSVGVNPSSTIAALAERNIEHFIRSTLNPDWQAPERRRLVPPWKEKSRDWKLAAPGIERKRTHVVSQPLGIEFTEKMRGFFLWEEPPKDPRAAEDFFRAETLGRAARLTIRFKLHACVNDVEAFMRDPTREILFTGGVLKIKSVETEVVGGAMHLLVEDGFGRRRMDYEVNARYGRHTFRLIGHKYLHNDPGLDAWADTSILFSKLLLNNPSGNIKNGYGVLRVTLDEFLYESVPSFRVTNSGGDSVRETQTLLRFMRFFTGGLENIYVPGAARLPRIFQKRGAS